MAADQKKLSTTGKKVVQLINQTVTGIYEDAVYGNYNTWFPGQDQSQPVNSVVLHSTMGTEAQKIANQMRAGLTQDDNDFINQYIIDFPREIANNYAKIIDNSSTKRTAQNKVDTDPYTQQIGVSRTGILTTPTYATFMEGRRLNKNISGYAGTNNTYSMCDIVCSIDIETNSGEHVYAVLGKLQTLSYSIYQQKQPVRVLGNMNAKDYVYGQRTIAGSLVFAVFNRHWLVDIYDELVNKGIMKNWHYVADELPPFNITVSFANEYGYDSKMALYGVRLMTEGQVMSINDIYIENTYQFVAMDIEYMDALNAWQTTNKINRRWTNTKAAGIIQSNADAKLAAAKKAEAEAAAAAKKKMVGKSVDNEKASDQNNQKNNKQEDLNKSIEAAEKELERIETVNGPESEEATKARNKLESLKKQLNSSSGATLNQQPLVKNNGSIATPLDNNVEKDIALFDDLSEEDNSVATPLDKTVQEDIEQFDDQSTDNNWEEDADQYDKDQKESEEWKKSLTLQMPVGDPTVDTAADQETKLYQNWQKEVERIEQEYQDAKIAANGDEDELADIEELHDAKIQNLAEQYDWKYEYISQNYPEKINGKTNHYNFGSQENTAIKNLNILQERTFPDISEDSAELTPEVQEANDKAVDISNNFKNTFNTISQQFDTISQHINQTKEENNRSTIDQTIGNMQEILVDYHALVNQDEDIVDDDLKSFYDKLNEIEQQPISNEEKFNALNTIKNTTWNTYQEFQSNAQKQASQNAIELKNNINNANATILENENNANTQLTEAKTNSITSIINNASDTIASYKNDVVQWLQDHTGQSEDIDIPEETQTWFDDLEDTVSQYNLSTAAEEAYNRGKQFFTEKRQNDIDRIFTTDQTDGLSIGTYTPETLMGQTEESLLDQLKLKYDAAKEDIKNGAAASILIANPTLAAAVGAHFIAKQGLLDKCFDNEASNIKQWFAERSSNIDIEQDSYDEKEISYDNNENTDYNIQIPSIFADNALGKQITDNYLKSTSQQEVVDNLTDNLNEKRQEILKNNTTDFSLTNSIKNQYQKLSKDFINIENTIREKIGLQQRSEITDLYDQYEDDIAQHYQTIDPTDPDNQKAYSPAIKMVNNMRELMEPNYNLPVNPTGTWQGAGQGGFNKPQRFSLDGGDTLGWGYGKQGKTTCITSCAIACPGTFLNPNGYDYVMDTDIAQDKAKAAGAYVRYGEGNQYAWESVSQEQLNQMYRPQPGDVVIVSTGEYQDGGHAMMVMEDGQHLIHTGSGISSYIDENGKFVDALDIIKRNETYKKEHNGQDSREFIDNLRRTGVDPHLTVDMLMTYKTGNSEDFEKEGDRYLIACLQTSKYADNVDMIQDSQLTALRNLKVR